MSVLMQVSHVQYLGDTEVSGWLNKGWYKINQTGENYLVKGNSKAEYRRVWTKGFEPYSEVMAYRIASYLNLPCVPYMLSEAHNFKEIKTYGIKHVSVCPSYITQGVQTINLLDFAKERGFNPKKDKRLKILEICEQAEVNLKMLYTILMFDALVGNVDRHFGNIELFIYPNKPPQFVPLFDNGASLLGALPATDILASGIPYIIDYARPFYRTHRNQIKLIPRNFYRYIDKRTLINNLMHAVEPMRPYIPPYRFYAIQQYLTWRVRYLEQVMEGTQ